MNVFLGLDPGAKGFITVYEPAEGTYKFYPMPEETNNEGKKVFSFLGLKKMANDFIEEYKYFKIVATIEDVTGRQGWSAQNNFNFGRVAGAQMMFLLMIGADIDFVRPQKWQAMMYQGFEKVRVPSSTGKTMIHDTKATSALVAKTLAPDIDFRRTTSSKNIDDNKTDSFLMALYGHRKSLRKS